MKYQQTNTVGYFFTLNEKEMRKFYCIENEK